MRNPFYDVALKNIDEAIVVINGITDNSKFKELQTSITASIHNAIHGIVDWYERQDYESFQGEADTLLRACMYVNNQLKHDKSLVCITYNVSGNRYPGFYPGRYGPPGVCWADFPDNGRPNARGKRCHYEEKLMNRDACNTLKQIQGIMEEANSII
jgi:hypothetical protein